MTLKLQAGMIYDQQGLKRAKALLKRNLNTPPKKQLKLPKFNWPKILYREILRSFGISILVMVNLTLVTMSIAWFGLIFSFISPVELLNMYGIESNQAIQVEEHISLEDSLSLLAPPPALGGK